MADKHFLIDLAKAIEDAMPDSIKAMGSDAEKQVKAMVQTVFQKMDLVMRDEFDAQTKVLGRTRKQLKQLEEKITELEKNSNMKK